MDKALCIHGHFYQPRRDDPWLGTVLPEGSAAPALDWNERICRESYGPMGWARRLDARGRIQDVVNSYEWISFNAGPTLMDWLEKSAPHVHERMVEADRLSVARLGHGNAMAQVYHHLIMPLASPLDKELEVAWAVDDFARRFGRAPEGMWLAETAVDLASLDVLASHGIRFTVLAPRQAASVAEPGSRTFSSVDESSLDIREPYLVELPSGRNLSVFFYHGPVSRAVAFERLLSDGEAFWRRITEGQGGGLLSVATDGETYGHHVPFGEMALAYLLAQGMAGRDGWRLTNFAAYLADNPPRRRVRLHESSSWSCVHGVERWRSDCGCTTGDHPGWNQRWRRPLRQALDLLKAGLDAHYFERGRALFIDPAKALTAYGAVLAGTATQDEFAQTHLTSGLAAPDQAAAWKLLAMEQWGLAMFASCAWFFDDLARIEPVNALTFALRAMELAERTGARGLEEPFLAILEGAWSNQPGKGSGRQIWNDEVRTRRETPDSLTAQALTLLWSRGGLKSAGATGAPVEVAWPGVTAGVAFNPDRDSGRLSGTVTFSWANETGRDVHAREWERSPLSPLKALFRTTPLAPTPGPRQAGPVIGEAKPDQAAPIPPDRPYFRLETLAWNKRQALAAAWIEAAEAKAWAEQESIVERGAGLFQAYEFYQRTQTRAHEWKRFWGVMCMAWVRGLSLDDKAERDLTGLLAEDASTHPDRVTLMDRIVTEGLLLLDESPVPWPRLEMLLERTFGLKLSPDLWRLQNRLWQMRPWPQAAARTLELANMEPGEEGR